MNNPEATEIRAAKSRRSIVTAAAWSMPVIAAAIAAPSASASPDPAAEWNFTGSCGAVGGVERRLLLTAGPTVPILAGTIVYVILAAGDSIEFVITLKNAAVPHAIVGLVMMPDAYVGSSRNKTVQLDGSSPGVCTVSTGVLA